MYQSFARFSGYVLQKIIEVMEIILKLRDVEMAGPCIFAND